MQTAIIDLPDDMIRLISKKCNYEDVMNLKLVNKKMNDTILMTDIDTDTIEKYEMKLIGNCLVSAYAGMSDRWLSIDGVFARGFKKESSEVYSFKYDDMIKSIRTEHLVTFWKNDIRINKFYKKMIDYLKNYNARDRANGELPNILYNVLERVMVILMSTEKNIEDYIDHFNNFADGNYEDGDIEGYVSYLINDISEKLESFIKNIERYNKNEEAKLNGFLDCIMNRNGDYIDSSFPEEFKSFSFEDYVDLLTFWESDDRIKNNYECFKDFHFGYYRNDKLNEYIDLRKKLFDILKIVIRIKNNNKLLSEKITIIVGDLQNARARASDRITRKKIYEYMRIKDCYFDYDYDDY
jgi:hypothetical protein